MYSTTLESVATARTRIEPRFDADAVRDMKAAAVDVMTIGGANLAAHAFRAGLVDECHLFVAPVVLGDGKRAFASDARVQLDLREERRFDNGIMYVHYAVRR